jgi:hypothetical protein
MCPERTFIIVSAIMRFRTHDTVARTPHFGCGAFDHSATYPLRRDAALVSAGCLIAMKDEAGKRPSQVPSSFYLDSFCPLTYARNRSGVERLHASSSCADVLQGEDKNHRQEMVLWTAPAHPTDKKTAALGKSRNEHERIKNVRSHQDRR